MYMGHISSGMFVLMDETNYNDLFKNDLVAIH
jgi:hypothetical protein